MAWLRLRPVTIVSALALVGVLQGSNATAEIRTRVIEYKQGDTLLKGYLAYNDVAYGRRPGVLIGPTWTGIGALSGTGNFIKRRAEAYAALGYVAFVADIYGDGKELPPPIATATEMKKFMDDRTLLRERARAGLDILRAQAVVDPNKILAAGYCFGGAAILELARSGADLAGIAIFHGSLSNPTPQDAQNIKARVIVFQGADDPAVPPAEVAAFEKEMRDASAALKAKRDDPRELDWQLVIYGNAVHSFTDPDAGLDPSRGYAYNAKADARSWIAMQNFFKEIVNR
jgi:dienelactone hydrolase